MAPNKPVKTGVLCPYSSIYPELSQNFIDGFFAGLPESAHSQVKIIPEYVKQGERSVVKEVLQKMFGFDNVDLITGLVSYRLIPELVPMIESRKKLAFFADLGEYIPYTHHISDHIFFNSFQYWQAEFALGRWAHREFGGKGAVFMPLYEAGYHMHSAFRQGTIDAGSKEIDYVVLPHEPVSEHPIRKYLDEYMLKFKKERLDFLHVLFSGNEAVEFLSAFYEAGLHKEIPLIVSPHMAAYEILRQAAHLDMTFYSASLWDYDSENRQNQVFKNRFTRRTGTFANTIALLGYEIGLTLAPVLSKLSAGQYDEVRGLLKKERIKTPRGERNFYLDSDYATPSVSIEKISLGNGNPQKMAIEKGKTLKYNHTVFEEIHRENVTGWMNPYLCV